jgi:hypothetical protein
MVQEVDLPIAWIALYKNTRDIVKTQNGGYSEIGKTYASENSARTAMAGSSKFRQWEAGEIEIVPVYL